MEKHPFFATALKGKEPGQEVRDRILKQPATKLWDQNYKL
jgi:hypothetical protein